jgi:hypothetical protein
MVMQSSPPIYARLGERELSVRWAWFRPEVQIGDTVRLPTDSSGVAGWQSFRVTGKQLRLDIAPGPEADASAAATVQAIHLDVEPIALLE